VRIFLWHGYLLSGTGSNEYTRALARTLSIQGHDVVVLSQEPRPRDHDLGGATALRPEVPGRLPVFVLDHYAEATPALLPTMQRGEVDQFVDAQVEAIRAAGPADLLIVNHVLLGGPVGAASGLPFVVKAHGSELEYAMRGHPDLCIWARQSLEAARDVVVGSEHVGRVLADLVGPIAARVVTPGVDIDQMVPDDRASARAALIEQARLDPVNPGDERLPDAHNAERIAAFLAGSDRPTVVYVGKLSQQKGVHLLLDALEGLDVRAFIVGFGPARGDLERSAADKGLDVLFTGPLQHRHLAHLWAAADVSVVPSVFPEAFGMVAAEAAATGCPPIVARHSGLAEVADGISTFLPEHLRTAIAFRRNDAADLRRALLELLSLGADDRGELSRGCRSAVKALWSWDSVARQMVGAVIPTGGQV
jgi:glycosyltransferase involved in cell wall biosynthesis